jgi:hypothetical protein
MSRKKTTAKCGFMTSKENANVHSIAFNNLTSGEVQALIRALQLARQESLVAQDLSSYLGNAFMEFHSTTRNSLAFWFYTKLADEVGDVVIRKDIT